MNSVDRDPIPLHVNIGGQLATHEIIGRESTVAEIHEYLARGMNIVIPDPRRIGKSAVLELLAESSTRDVTVVQTSVQRIKTTEAFFLHLATVLFKHQSLPAKLSQNVSRFVDSVGVKTTVEGIPLEVGLRTKHSHKHPVELLTEMVASLHERLGESELLVLAIDEFTESLLNIAANSEGESDGPAEATTLLQTLQQLRKTCGRVRWVLTGSIGLHHAIAATHCTAAVIGDCKNINVGPLSPVNAAYLSRCLAMGERVELTDDAHVVLAHSVSGIPILVHAVIDDLRNRPHSSDPFDERDVLAAVQRYVEDNDESRSFEHFVSRLPTYFEEPELSIARSMLDKTSLNDAGIATSELLDHAASSTGASDELARSVLSTLIDDHYLTREGSHMRWRYSVLALVWRTKRTLGR